MTQSMQAFRFGKIEVNLQVAIQRKIVDYVWYDSGLGIRCWFSLMICGIELDNVNIRCRHN